MFLFQLSLPRIIFPANMLTYASNEKNSFQLFKILIFLKNFYKENKFSRSIKNVGTHNNLEYFKKMQEIVCSYPSQITQIFSHIK